MVVSANCSELVQQMLWNLGVHSQSLFVLYVDCVYAYTRNSKCRCGLFPCTGKTTIVIGNICGTKNKLYAIYKYTGNITIGVSSICMQITQQ